MRRIATGRIVGLLLAAISMGVSSYFAREAVRRRHSTTITLLSVRLGGQGKKAPNKRMHATPERARDASR